MYKIFSFFLIILFSLPKDSTSDERGQVHHYKALPKYGPNSNQPDLGTTTKFGVTGPEPGTDKRRKRMFDDGNAISEESTEEERLRNLKILAGIVGGPSEAFNDVKDYSQVEKSPQKPSKEDKYWVSSSLTQALSGAKKIDAPASGKAFSFGFSGNQNGSSSGFSLLSKFGKSNDVEADSGKSTSTRRSADHRNPFKHDSSDDEEEAGNSASGKGLMDLDPVDLFAQKLRERASATKGASESFFFARFDPRFAEGRQFFVAKQTVDEMRTKHDANRPALAEIMKKKLKRKAKKQEKLTFDLKQTNKKGGIFKKKFARGKKFNRK